MHVLLSWFYMGHFCFTSHYLHNLTQLLSCQLFRLLLNSYLKLVVPVLYPIWSQFYQTELLKWSKYKYGYWMRDWFICNSRQIFTVANKLIIPKVNNAYALNYGLLREYGLMVDIWMSHSSLIWVNHFLVFLFEPLV